MRPLRIVLTLVVLLGAVLFAHPSASVAGDEIWSTTSLAGYRIRDLILDPNDPSVVVAIAEDDVVVSHDTGTTWSSLGLGQVGALAIDPTNSQQWWVSYGETLFFSSDAGVKWEQRGTGLTGRVSHISYDPRDPAVIYASTNDTLYLSRDGGSTWKSAGLPVRGTVAAILFDVSNTNTLFVALADQRGQLWKSTDGATSWASIGDKVPAQYEPTFYSLASNSQGHIYAATDAGVFMTSDGGGSWTTLSEEYANLLVVTPDEQGDIFINYPYYGLFRASANLTDGSQLGEDAFRNMQALAISQSEGATIFVATDDGFFASRDHGDSWSSPNNIGLTQVWAGLPGRAGTVFAADNYYGQLFRSTDFARTWAGTDLQGVQALVGSPHVADLIYAGTQQGLFVSDTGGTSWRATDLPTSISVRSLAVHPTEASTLYVGKDDGILRSSDGGTTWVSLNLPQGVGRVAQVAIASDGGTVYVVAGDSVFKSGNDGESWSKLYTLAGNTPSVSLSTSDPETVYIASPEGVGISHDQGDHLAFQPIATDPNRGFYGRVSVVEDPRSAHTLYAVIAEEYYGGERGIVVSSDFGLTWSGLTRGVTPGQGIQSFAIDTGNIPTFYLVLQNGLGGVWQYSAVSLPATPTPVPTSTPIPTHTPVPTFTALPNSTAGPTPTPWQQAAGTSVAQVTVAAPTAARPTQLILSPAQTRPDSFPGLDNPLILAGAGLVCAGAGVVAIAGIFGLSRWRRSKRATSVALPISAASSVPVGAAPQPMERDVPAKISAQLEAPPLPDQFPSVAVTAEAAPIPPIISTAPSEPVVDHPAETAPLPTEPAPTTRPCPNCGKRNAATAKFCMQCGRSLPPS